MSEAAFRSGHPLDVRFSDDRGEPVLEIEDGRHRGRLTLEIVNIAPESVRFGRAADAKSSHHLVVRFRRGTLSAQCLRALQENPQTAVEPQHEWRLTHVSHEKDQDITLGLRHVGSSPELAPGESMRLYLRPINAATGVGARGTTIELNLQDVWLTSSGTRAKGWRTQYVHVANQGDRAPFRMAPLRPPLVNDDATMNAFAIRLVNESGRALPLHEPGQDAPARFIVSCTIAPDDGGNAEPEALTTRRWAELVNVEPTPGTAERLSSSAAEWIVTPQAGCILEPGKSFDIRVLNVRTRLPNGHARVRVRYENVPGYCDGEVAGDIGRHGLQGDVSMPSIVRFRFSQGDVVVMNDGTPQLHATDAAGSASAKQFVIGGKWGQPVDQLILEAKEVRLTGKLGFDDGSAVRLVAPSEFLAGRDRLEQVENTAREDAVASQKFVVEYVKRKLEYLREDLQEPKPPR